MTNNSTSGNSSKSIDRLVEIFRIFSPSDVECSIAEVCQKTGMSRATAYRMLSAFVRVGLLEKNSETNKYGPGPTLFQVGMLYLSRTDITRVASPVIKTMNELTGENVNVVIFDKGNIVVVMKEEANYDFRLASRVGTIVPAYPCASGRAFLSELNEADIQKLYPNENLEPLTQKTITTKTELRRELEVVRKTAVSIDQEGTFEGVEGIASVIRDAAGKPVAALSMTIPTFRMSQEKRQRIAEFVKKGASLISYRLGYRSTQDTIRDIADLRSWWQNSQGTCQSSSHPLGTVLR